MKIYIATFADCKYLQHASVLLVSLNKVVNKHSIYQVYLFHTCKNKSIINRVINTSRGLKRNIIVDLCFIDAQLDLKLQSKKENISRDIYHKVLIYDYLPSKVKRTLFLDADIVLKSDPSILFELDLEGCIMGAVKDYFLKFPIKARDAIDLKSSDDYFNSGVMVIDLDKWRENSIPERALRFAIKRGHLTKLHDQDALNHAVSGNWKRIDSLWNPRPSNTVIIDGKEKVMSRDEVYRSDLSFLIHYSGSNKPWKFTSTHPARKYYRKYLKETWFNDFCLEDKSLLNGLFLVCKLIKNELLYLRRKFMSR